jgi:hypothetical protein
LVNSDGRLIYYQADTTNGIVPAVYIRTQIYKLSGDGTKESPYVVIKGGI